MPASKGIGISCICRFGTGIPDIEFINITSLKIADIRTSLYEQGIDGLWLPRIVKKFNLLNLKPAVDMIVAMIDKPEICPITCRFQNAEEGLFAGILFERIGTAGEIRRLGAKSTYSLMKCLLVTIRLW